MSRYRRLALENLELAHPKLLAELRATGELDAHLDGVADAAEEMFDALVSRLRRAQFDEKEEDHLKRAHALDQINRQADEIVRAELIQIPSRGEE